MRHRYIIDNYDDLPDNILFIHPTRYQWHNDDPDYDGLPMLRHFRFPYLASEGYVNIRCAWSLGCPSEIKPLEEEGEHRQAVHAGGDYKKAFEHLFPGAEVPKFVGVSCCAQFAVTREKIRERKKEDYVKYREWLLETPLDDSISGRILEYSWHSKSIPSSVVTVLFKSLRYVGLRIPVQMSVSWALILTINPWEHVHIGEGKTWAEHTVPKRSKLRPSSDSLKIWHPFIGSTIPVLSLITPSPASHLAHVKFFSAPA